MKTIPLIAAILLFPLLSFAQSPGFMELFNQYSGREGYTTVDMSGEVFRAMNKLASAESDNIQVKRILIVVSEMGSDTFENDVNRTLAEEHYKTLSTVRNGTQNVEFYVKPGNGTYKEVLMNTYGDGEHVVVLITGDDLDINAVSRIAGNSPQN